METAPGPYKWDEFTFERDGCAEGGLERFDEAGEEGCAEKDGWGG